MTPLSWDLPNERRYETGISRGVFYPSDGPGVVWNGLVSVEHGFIGADTTDLFVDGVKYLTFVGSRNYQAEIKAFSAPVGFEAYDGDRAIIPGFILTKQPKPRFNLAYRTDTSDGYKLHLVFNVLATLTNRDSQTVNDQANPTTLTWKIDAVPVQISGFHPSAHLTIGSKSTRSDILDAVESILYGTEVTDPRFPTVQELAGLFS